MKEKRNSHPGKPPDQWKDQPSRRDPQDNRKKHSSRYENQKAERCTEHLNHWHRRHSPRCSGGGWALGAETWALEVSPWELAGVRGEETASATREQCAMDRESGTLRAGEGKARAQGTREKVRTRRRDKRPLLGRGEEEGKPP